MKKTIDIYRGGPYPASALSNLADYKFNLDGVKCGSIEGFLESLKYKNRFAAKCIAKKSGKRAKRKGERRSSWKKTQKLYWRGKAYDRSSAELNALVRRAYETAFLANADFRAALCASMGCELIHSLGNKNACDTVLTEREFIKHLEYLRRNYLTQKIIERV